MFNRIKGITGLILAGALLAQPIFLAAQDTAKPQPAAPSTQPSEQMHPIGLPDLTRGNGHFPNVLRPYAPFELSAPEIANGPTLDRLFRDGKVYLSMADAVTLAIENNLDVAMQRLNAPMADTDVLRARAGAPIHSVRPGVTEGSGVGIASITVDPLIGPAPLYGGSPAFNNGVSSYDPVIFGTLSAEHSTSLNTTNASSLVGLGNTGPTTVQVITTRPNTGLANFTYSEAFQTGSQLNVTMDNNRQTSPFNTLNPQFSSLFSATLTQHFMDGFGRGPNTRLIKIAKNDRELTDLVFKLQVITTVSQVEDLYWDLVSSKEQVEVAERSLKVSTKLLNDNRRQVEIGTMAPLSVVQAEAQRATDQQSLIVAQTNYQQLGMAMKNLVLKNISDTAVLLAPVIPTDKIEVPPVEPVVPLQDLVTTALSARGELAESRIDMTNRNMSMKTIKNSLLPQVDGFATWTSRGVSGVGHIPQAVVLGGLSSSLGDAVLGTNPDYTIGISVGMTLRNRSAQADLAQALLERRQADLHLRQIENQVRVEVASAQISLTQGRAQIEAATHQRVLEEQSLDAEQKKFQLGASTAYNVILVERDLVTALSAEVAARDAYMKARVEMDRATGQTLLHNNIMLDEAAQGQLKHKPTALPASQQDK